MRSSGVSTRTGRAGARDPGSKNGLRRYAPLIRAPSSAVARRSTAKVVAAGVDGTACRADFVLTAMRNGRTTTSSLVLVSRDGANIEIGIANMEIDRFIGMDPADGPRAQGDFEVFSNLLTHPIQGQKPFVLETSPGGSSGCCGRANCLVAGS